MSVRVTVDLPEELAQRARAAAAQSRRQFEDVLVDWLGRAASEIPIESMSDDEISSLCDGEMEFSQQDELTDLLTQNREGDLLDSARARLEELMLVYRSGLIQKAKAWKVAVARGLRSPPN
jgi:hypothetical protein